MNNIRSVMDDNPLTLRPEQSLKEVIQIFADHHMDGTSMIDALLTAWWSRKTMDVKINSLNRMQGLILFYLSYTLVRIIIKIYPYSNSHHQRYYRKYG